MQNLVNVALGDLFPEQCEEWASIRRHVHEVFMRDRREKISAVARDLVDTEDWLQHALRSEVVDHVINIFPYVLIQLLACLTNHRTCYLIQVAGSRWTLFYWKRTRDEQYAPSMCDFHRLMAHPSCQIPRSFLPSASGTLRSRRSSKDMSTMPSSTACQ